MLNTHQAMERLGCAFGTIGQMVDAGVLPDRAERIAGAQKHHARFLAKDIAAVKAVYQPRCHLALQMKVLKAAVFFDKAKMPKTNGHGTRPPVKAVTVTQEPAPTVQAVEERVRARHIYPPVNQGRVRAALTMPDSMQALRTLQLQGLHRLEVSILRVETGLARVEHKLDALLKAWDVSYGDDLLA